MSASSSPNCSVKEGLLKPTKLRFVIEYHFLKLNYFFRLLLTQHRILVNGHIDILIVHCANQDSANFV